MSETTPNLWPPIDMKILSPGGILRMQAGQLATLTQGVLRAEVHTLPSQSGGLLHDFKIVVPALDGYTYDLFKAWHAKELFYPVTVTFAPWKREAVDAYLDETFGIDRDPAGQYKVPDVPATRQAATADGLVELVREILNSDHTRSVLSSLISRVNEGDIVGSPAA